MATVSEALEQLGDLSWLKQAMVDQVARTQADGLFKLAALKSARWNGLRAAFQGGACRTLWLSHNLANFGCQIDGVQTGVLEKGFFETSDDALFRQRAAQVAGAVVVINNNDVGQASAQPYFAHFVRCCPSTVFVAWDWDNHHWLDLSTFLAAHCDLYAPAHHENLYLLSRFNWLTAGPVYCACVQWPRAFLAEHRELLFGSARSNAPLGMHIPYAPFQFRLQVLSTLSQHYPSIGFSDRSFHARTPLDRLQEWAAHKAHWIVPVLNDVPIRIFDALISGGIPIIPESLRLLPPVAQMPAEHVAFYTPADVVAPQALVESVNARFDALGPEGIRARHEFALQQHHGDTRMRQVLDYVQRVLNLPDADWPA